MARLLGVSKRVIRPTNVPGAPEHPPNVPQGTFPRPLNDFARFGRSFLPPKAEQGVSGDRVRRRQSEPEAWRGATGAERFGRYRTNPVACRFSGLAVRNDSVRGSDLCRFRVIPGGSDNRGHVALTYYRSCHRAQNRQGQPVPSWLSPCRRTPQHILNKSRGSDSPILGLGILKEVYYAPTKRQRHRYRWRS